MLVGAEDGDSMARAVSGRCPRLRGQGRRPRGAVRRGAARHHRGPPPEGPVDPPARAPATKAPELTEREMQVLTGMSRGRSNAEIGRELFLSEDTVKTHARRLFRKLGAADRAQAVAVGYRAGSSASTHELSPDSTSPRASGALGVGPGSPG